jgi:adenosylhomocysteine nucleosidase
MTSGLKPAVRVLVVAAEKFELKHIRPRDGWTMVANGPGPKLARAAVESVGDRFDVLVSTGLCGALDPRLFVGDVFVATEVNGMPTSLPVSSRPFAKGPLVSVDFVAGTADEKRRLYDSGAKAVEMEAAAVAEMAQARGADFYCIRSVSDVAEENFWIDFNAARGSDGRFNVMRILGQAARRPWTGLPELIRLRRNAGVAAKALGEFFADCEF